jgi:DUF438 domain-containing protein
MEQATRWDDYLIAEHELIERSMAVLRTCLDGFDKAVSQHFQMQRALDFLLAFGDTMHNRKEENILFPLMIQRGLPAQGGPIGVMLMEHESERTLLQRMLAQLTGLATAPEETRQEFRQQGLDYLRIRAEHIWKENDILYPMGRKVLTAEDEARLLDEFIALDTKTYGDQARDHYRQMVEEVEQGGDKKKKLIRSLSYEQLDAIMEAMPFEMTFVDAADTVAYFNRLDKPKLFPRTRSVIGRKVQKCHPEKSVATVEKIVTGFMNKTMDKAEFWIDFRGDKVLIRYFPVYNDNGDYMGVLEVTQEIGWIQGLTGQKRLLD